MDDVQDGVGRDREEAEKGRADHCGQEDHDVQDAETEHPVDLALPGHRKRDAQGQQPGAQMHDVVESIRRNERATGAADEWVLHEPEETDGDEDDPRQRGPGLDVVHGAVPPLALFTPA